MGIQTPEAAGRKRISWIVLPFHAESSFEEFCTVKEILEKSRKSESGVFQTFWKMQKYLKCFGKVTETIGILPTRARFWEGKTIKMFFYFLEIRSHVITGNQPVMVVLWFPVLTWWQILLTFARVEPHLTCLCCLVYGVVEGVKVVLTLMEMFAVSITFAVIVGRNDSRNYV